LSATLTTGFDALPLTEPVAQAVRELGYLTPTEIQAAVIPHLLAGRDVIGQAQTGTGKTAAFGIPIVQQIDVVSGDVQALVLTPTRELAQQVAGELRALSKHRPIGIAVIYGGAAMGPQVRALQNGAQIVVGTPGRILDHLERGTLRLGTVRTLVLDEADRMLDMGFMPDVLRIIRHTPRRRQTALFSATMPLPVRQLARFHMREPVEVAVRAHETTVATVEQVYYEVAERDKVLGLVEVLEREQPAQAIIFRRTQEGVDRLTGALQRRGYAAEALHGNLSQRERDAVLQRFRAGEIPLLIATNVAARGLDIPEVSHVINFDVPEDAETYVHRIGRTARAGRRGKAITFVSEWDGEVFRAIRRLTNGALREERLGLYTG